MYKALHNGYLLTLGNSSVVGLLLWQVVGGEGGATGEKCWPLTSI